MFGGPRRSKEQSLPANPSSHVQFPKMFNKSFFFKNF